MGTQRAFPYFMGRGVGGHRACDCWCQDTVPPRLLLCLQETVAFCPEACPARGCVSTASAQDPAERSNTEIRTDPWHRNRGEVLLPGDKQVPPLDPPQAPAVPRPRRARGRGAPSMVDRPPTLLLEPPSQAGALTFLYAPPHLYAHLSLREACKPLLGPTQGSS